MLDISQNIVTSAWFSECFVEHSFTAHHLSPGLYLHTSRDGLVPG